MSSDRAKNIGLVIVLHVIFLVPYLFIPWRWMLDIVSAAMLVFAIYNLKDYGKEAWWAFWDGDRSRSALALYGVVLLFLSAILGRTYGISWRAAGSPAWVEATPLFAYTLYLLLIGFILFRKASPDPQVPRQTSPVVSWISIVVISVVLTMTKALEPLIMIVGKFVAHLAR